MRESEEEVGLQSGDVAAVLGALPARVSNAGFVVHTIVARIRAGFESVPDPREVDRVLLASLEELTDPGRWAWRRVSGVRRSLPFFDFAVDAELSEPGESALWGLTGRLTWDLLERFGHRMPTDPESP